MTRLDDNQSDFFFYSLVACVLCIHVCVHVCVVFGVEAYIQGLIQANHVPDHWTTLSAKETNVESTLLFYYFETGSHELHTGLKFGIQARLALNSGLPSSTSHCLVCRHVPPHLAPACWGLLLCSSVFLCLETNVPSWVCPNTFCFMDEVLVESRVTHTQSQLKSLN